MTCRKDEYFQKTINAFQIAFRHEHIAMCYRNLGFYFMRRGKWSAAVNCDLLSLRYDEANEKDIQSELNQIQQKTRLKNMSFSETKMHELKEKYGVPIGANEDLVSMACCLGCVFLKQKKYEKVKSIFKIGISLLSSFEIDRMLKWMSERDHLLRRGQRPTTRLASIYRKGRFTPSCYEVRLEGGS